MTETETHTHPQVSPDLRLAPGDQLTHELRSASRAHALWTLTAELRQLYGQEAEHISVTASPQADTGRLTADTLRVLDLDFDILMPDLGRLRRACETDIDLRDALIDLADLNDPEEYARTEEDLGDHLLGSPAFLTLKRAVDAWLVFADPPERPGWPQRLDLVPEDRRPVVLPSSMEITELSVSEFVTLRRRLLEDRAERGW